MRSTSKTLFVAATFSILFASFSSAGAIQRTVVAAHPPEGYATMRVPTLAVLKDGTILLQSMAKKGKGDWSAGDVFQQRSTDGGKTWSAPKVILSSEKSTVNALPIVGGDGTLHLLVMRDYGTVDHLKSHDGGQTFSDPQPLTPVLNEWAKRVGYDWTVVAPGPGSGIQLRSGRLIAPLWMSNSPDRKHSPTLVTTIYSDDNGKSWQVGDIVAQNEGDFTNPNESDIVELPDGRVMIDTRNGALARRRMFEYSADGATGWSKPVFADDLFEPICQASAAVVTLPDGKTAVIHIAPAGPDGEAAKVTGATTKPSMRENLTLSASFDNGKTWPIHKILDATRSAYSDTAIGPDGRIYIAYESGQDAERKNLTTGITFLSIDPGWIVAK